MSILMPTLATRNTYSCTERSENRGLRPIRMRTNGCERDVAVHVLASIAGLVVVFGGVAVVEQCWVIIQGGEESTCRRAIALFTR